MLITLLPQNGIGNYSAPNHINYRAGCARARSSFSTTTPNYSARARHSQRQIERDCRHGDVGFPMARCGTEDHGGVQGSPGGAVRRFHRAAMETGTTGGSRAAPGAPCTVSIGPLWRRGPPGGPGAAPGAPCTVSIAPLWKRRPTGGSRCRPGGAVHHFHRAAMETGTTGGSRAAPGAPSAVP